MSSEWKFSAQEKQVLLDLARKCITYGIAHDRSPPVTLESYPPHLHQPAATFVTLHLAGRLRGCIGQLHATEPLVVDVCRHAHAAAFHDPRFPPVQESEVPDLEIHISVLEEPMALRFSSEDDLLAQLQPGKDGLILRAGTHSATFLPDVWASLPDPKQFLQHLKLKARLKQDFWSPQIQALRYHTVSIP